MTRNFAAFSPQSGRLAWHRGAGDGLALRWSLRGLLRVLSYCGIGCGGRI
jgi:hypothetical protein